jgi:hypothetical protein
MARARSERSCKPVAKKESPFIFTEARAARHGERWGEDGLLGIADHQCRLAFSLALWNGAAAPR